MSRTGFTVAAALALLPCAASAQLRAPAPSRDTTTTEYYGAYQRGFEQSWFMPCGAATDDTTWWVTLTDDALRQRDSILATIAVPANSKGLSVRWRGTVSERMPAGHMGHGTRYLLVSKILEIRPLLGISSCGFKS
ncbi:MAG: hypothetical protein ABI664_06495 [bacterium]